MLNYFRPWLTCVCAVLRFGIERNQNHKSYCTYFYCAMTIYFFEIDALIAFIYQVFTVSIHYISYSDNSKYDRLHTCDTKSYLLTCILYWNSRLIIRTQVRIRLALHASIIFPFSRARALRSFLFWFLSGQIVIILIIIMNIPIWVEHTSDRLIIN